MDYLHITDKVSIAGYPDGLGLRFPELCCNCGASENVSWIETALFRTILIPTSIMVGFELTLPVRLPSCPFCIPTMSRNAPTLTGLTLLFVMPFLVASFPSWFIAGFFLDAGPRRFDWMLGIALVLATSILVLWFGVLRSPRRGQSTAFQPVRLVGVRRRWFIGEIKQITLNFTNEAYRYQFVERNPELLTNNVVRIQ